MKKGVDSTLIVEYLVDGLGYFSSSRHLQMYLPICHVDLCPF